MEYTKEVLADKKVKITLKITKEEWEKALQDAYEHTKQKYRVQGFRTGKAPRKVIEKEYGDTVFYDEALNNCFYVYYEQALVKEKLETVGNPRLDVDKIDETGVTMTVTTEVYPEVELGAYTGLTIEKAEIKVSSAEVNAEVEAMREKASRMVVVEREAKNGDTVVIDFVGKKDGVAFDGGTAKGYELKLGSGSFIPGFEDQLVGAKAGEEKVIDVTFPAEYPAEDLAGKPCTFDVTVHEVREKVMPELDDEFAKNVSEFDTLEEYKKSVKEELKKEKQAKAEQEAEEKLLEKITENSKVEIPEVMVHEQAHEFVHQFAHQLEHQGLNINDYVKYMNTTVEELEKSRMDDARKTVKTRLVLEAVMKKEGISLEKEELEKAIKEQADLNGVDVEEFKKTVHEHYLNQIASNLILNKLFEFLKKNNNM
ncbi:MAG TPA: trigger factor [Clostridiales bacterium]|nr:trigger factor [Clostridiales bacterium]